MHTTAHRRILAIVLAFLTAAACRRKAVELPPSHDPTLEKIAQPLPTFPDYHLAATTPDAHGLVASVLTPLAAKAATPHPLDWVPGAITPAGRIVWAKDFADGYRSSVELNKGMVVLFGTPGGAWYEKVLASFDSPELAALADQAIWIRADPTKEVMAKNVCTALGVEHTPTISVLDPDTEMISEEQRIEGYEEPAKLASDLRVPLLRANGKLPRVPTKKP